MSRLLKLRLIINKKNKSIVTSIPKRKLKASDREKIMEMKWAKVSLEGFE